jgi:hypothetical protein
VSDAIIERADQLDSLLIECSDRTYLAMELQAALTYEGTALEWDALYDKSEGVALL